MRMRTIFRIFLLTCGLFYLAAITRVLLADWLLNHPTPENLRRGVHWLPSSPQLWSAYARSRSELMADSSLPEVIAAYQAALSRNPFDLPAWDGLATAYLQQGDLSHAEAAMRGAVAAVPHSPSATWRLANFLLVQDRVAEAMPLFRTAASFDPNLCPAVFDLGWKLLGDPQQILEELVPDRLPARMQYLEFLVWRKGLPREAYPVWQKILASGTEAAIKQGEAYVEALAAGGFGSEASRVWRELLAQTGSKFSQPAGERIFNGDFEAPLRNAGLDWRMAQAPGYQVTLDNFQSQHGTRALRVKFNGTTNPEFAALQQWIPVEPGTTYHFQAYLRTENISTDNGLFLLLTPVGAPPNGYWERLTENRVGSTPWTEEQLVFRTGPDTRVILVQLRRRASTKLNNLLQGTVWLDNVSLYASRD